LPPNPKCRHSELMPRVSPLPTAVGVAIGLIAKIESPLEGLRAPRRRRARRDIYQGETLGYRTLYVWFERENLVITLQTNSQPAPEADKLHELVGVIHSIVRDDAK
jgi:hypothetical protein